MVRAPVDARTVFCVVPPREIQRYNSGRLIGTFFIF
jgi:hypothetical protein